MKRRGLNFIIPFIVIALAIALGQVAPELTELAMMRSFDIFQRLEPRPYEDVSVRIVNIDDQSIAEIGQWPWPRTTIAELVDKLTEAGAAAIAFDIVFSEPDRTSPKMLAPQLERSGVKGADLARLLDGLPDHDDVLAEAIGRSNVIIGNVLVDEPQATAPARKAGFAQAGLNPYEKVRQFSGAVVNLPDFEKAARGNGFFNQLPEWDRVVRRVPLVLLLNGAPQPSLAAEALRTALGAKSYIVKGVGASGETGFGHNTGMISVKIGANVVPTDAEGRIWMHYAPKNEDRYISARDVLSGKFDPQRVEGNIIVIGGTFAAGNDLVATPLEKSMGGVEVHAQLMEQVLQGWFLTRLDLAHGAEVLFMLVVAGGLILILPRIGAIRGAFAAAVCLSLASAACWIAFTEFHLLFDPIYPTLVVLLVYGIATLLGYMQTEVKQREIRNAFSRYMSPHLVDQLAKHPEKLVLGGEMRQMTLMFCDIRGFTTISEGLNAHQLTHFINQFLSPMTEIVMQHRGTIDKYIGDCIMAFWNAPLDDPDHARNAIKTAQAMRRRLVELNAEWEKEAKIEGRVFKPVKIGIGINTGECCVGNMGSHQRFDYSVLGDAVNLASRLEGLGKTYGVDLVLGESTVELAGNWPTIELDLVAVKGKSKAVTIFTLLANAEERAEATPPVIARHRELLKTYRKQDWAAAARIIDGGIADGMRDLAGFYELYRHRIDEFVKAPPPEDWDGVYVAKEK